LLTHKPKGADGKEAVLLSQLNNPNNAAAGGGPIATDAAAAAAQAAAAAAAAGVPLPPGTTPEQWAADGKGSKKLMPGPPGQKNFACGICGKRYAHQVR
jgi:hypothetical protein